ncbi:MAG: DUF1330 domain-containing protein [Rhodospirillaceae bacterium]|nr:DUF1330 domain-containing protein [Rhodospirillaceae bacterium]
MKESTMVARRTVIALSAAAGVTSTAQAQQAAPAPAPDAPRPGYLFVMGTSTNPEKIAAYARTLAPIYEKFQGYYIASGGVGRGVTVLEGTYPHTSLLIAKFPAVDGPNAFWWSPEYRAAVELRQGAGTFNVLKLKGSPGDVGKPEGRPAYLISIAEIKYPEKLKPYVEVARPLLNTYGGRFISGGGRKDIELLEGEFGNKTVNVVQFPSLEALRKFYNDPGYQKVIPVRQSAGDYIVLEADSPAPRT